MRVPLRRTGRALLTLLLAATAFTVAPTATAHAAPDGSAPGFTMLTTKPTVDMSKAKVLRFGDAAGTDATLTCGFLAPYPPYFVDVYCHVYTGVASVFIQCSDGIRQVSTPMVAVGDYYGRAYCGPPAYGVGYGYYNLA